MIQQTHAVLLFYAEHINYRGPRTAPTPRIGYVRGLIVDDASDGRVMPSYAAQIVPSVTE